MSSGKPLLFYALFALALQAPQNAHAANEKSDGKQVIRVEITEEMQQAEGIYQTAMKKLSKEQQAYLTYLDESLIKTLNPDAQLMQTEAYLKSCMKTDADISKNTEKYSAALNDFRNDISKSQAKMWDKQRDLYAKADFIDPNVLRSHLQVEKAMILAVFDTLVKKNIDEGKHDCELIKDKLADYMG